MRGPDGFSLQGPHALEELDHVLAELINSGEPPKSFLLEFWGNIMGNLGVSNAVQDAINAQKTAAQKTIDETKKKASTDVIKDQAQKLHDEAAAKLKAADEAAQKKIAEAASP